MENLDSESYWNRSSSKAFSFDDDGDESGDLENPSGWGVLDDALSELKFESATGGAVDLSIKSIISDEALDTILAEQSLDDRVITKGITPEEELKLLRRQIQTLHHPSAEATACKMLLGKTVSLEPFKTLDEKMELLDAVLAYGGGDAVIGVVLFLKRTLNRVNFYKILEERPPALQHYISYLQSNKLTCPEAVKLLRLFGKRQEAALFEFDQILKDTSNLELRKENLRQLVERCSGSDTGVATLCQQIFHNTYKMHELLEQERDTLGKLVPPNASPVEVLYVLCSKHTNWREQDLTRATSPFRFCADYQISASQFEWTALNERAKAHAYADLESIFERVPTWNPIKQKQFHISFSLEAAILRLHELNAPTVVLYQFLSKMPNASEKLPLAKRVRCIKAEIDALAALKDAAQLTQLRDTLVERSEEQFHCDAAIKGLQQKQKRWSTDNIKLKL